MVSPVWLQIKRRPGGSYFIQGGHDIDSGKSYFIHGGHDIGSV